MLAKTRTKANRRTGCPTLPKPPRHSEAIRASDGTTMHDTQFKGNSIHRDKHRTQTTGEAGPTSQGPPRTPSRIATGPNGNGSPGKALTANKACALFKPRGLCIYSGWPQRQAPTRALCRTHTCARQHPWPNSHDSQLTTKRPTGKAPSAKRLVQAEVRRASPETNRRLQSSNAVPRSGAGMRMTMATTMATRMPHTTMGLKRDASMYAESAQVRPQPPCRSTRRHTYTWALPIHRMRRAASRAARQQRGLSYKKVFALRPKRMGVKTPTPEAA